ncbi:MAG: AgmX/PglI C-terminal domain-containing protein [Polyangiaceae bacterium]|nr:AgmX/PglI C-terminal domain-containing protein [Polyangiaceae bacterium]
MQPRTGEGSGLSSEPGRITRAMRAASVSAPQCLRVALVRRGRVEEERLFRPGAEITLGQSERATFVLDEPTLPAKTPIFRENQLLVVPPGVAARVHDGDSLLELPAAAAARQVALGPNARGSMTVGEARLLFQMVVAPVRVQPQLPLALLRDPERIDWLTTIIAAFSFVAHFGVIGTLYSDWVDPVLDEGVTISGVVSEIAALPVAPDVEQAQAPADGPRAQLRDTPRGVPGTGPGKGLPSTAAPPAHTGLGAELEKIELSTLGALGTGRAATEGVLGHREVATAALDAAATSGRGISDGPALVFGGGRPVTPGAPRDLSVLADGRASTRFSETGGKVAVAGPRPEAISQPPVVQGSTVSDAARVVAGLRAGFRACYKRGLEERPDAAGGVRITLRVGAGGEVQGVTTSATGSLPPSVASCVAARAKSAAFSPPDGGAAVVVVPVTFVLQR